MRVAHFGIAILLVTCVPGSGAQGQDHALTIEEHAFDYGPEDWKAEVEGQEGTDWNASLGGRLDATLRFDPAQGDPDHRWRATATLSDGITTVPGRAETTGAGRFEVRFDIDGQRPLPGAAAVPALVPGTWTLRVEVHLPGPPDTYVGSAQTTLDTTGLEALRMADGDLQPLPTRMVPEGLLPHINEVGPGLAVLMNAATAVQGERVALEVDAGAPGRSLMWRIYGAAMTLLPSIGSPLPGTPLGTVTAPNPAGVGWSTGDPVATTADADGIARLGLDIGNDTRDAFIVAAYDPDDGGLAVFAVGLGGSQPRFQRIEAPAPGEEGAVTVTVTPGTEAPRLGELHATTLAGSQALQRVPLTPGDGVLEGRLDGRGLRAATESGYGLFVVLLDGDGDYAGHGSFQRGFSIDFDVPSLGAGHAAPVGVVIQHLGSDLRSGVAPGLALEGTLRFQDMGPEAVTVPEGGRLTTTYTVTPEAAGAYELVATVDTGDIHHEARRSVTVLPSDAFEQQQKPWYDPGKYVPGAPLPLALLALALIAARRKR